MVAIIALFFEHEHQFNAILYQQYENQGSDSTDSNDEMVHDRQSESEVIREAFLTAINAVFKVLYSVVE
jgi:hypothetical protein